MKVGHALTHKLPQFAWISRGARNGPLCQMIGDLLGEASRILFPVYKSWMAFARQPLSQPFVPRILHKPSIGKLC